MSRSDGSVGSALLLDSTLASWSARGGQLTGSDEFRVARGIPRASSSPPHPAQTCPQVAPAMEPPGVELYHVI